MWGTFFFKSRGLNVPDSNDATSCFSSLSLKNILLVVSLASKLTLFSISKINSDISV